MEPQTPGAWSTARKLYLFVGILACIGAVILMAYPR
jgi:hypothetical protein